MALKQPLHLQRKRLYRNKVSTCRIYFLRTEDHLTLTLISYSSLAPRESAGKTLRTVVE